MSYLTSSALLLAPSTSIIRYSILKEAKAEYTRMQ